MSAPKVKVVYVDGREEIVRVTPRSLLMTEERYGAQSSQVKFRFTYYAAWVVLNKAGKEPAGFEEWLDKISDLEDVYPSYEPCPVCGEVGGCTRDDYGPLFHVPPDEEDDGSADPTKLAQPAVES